MTGDEETPGNWDQQEIFRELVRLYPATRLFIPCLEIAARQIRDADTESENDCE